MSRTGPGALTIRDTLAKEVLAPTGMCHGLHPSSPQPQAALQVLPGDCAAALLPSTPGSQQLLRGSEGSAAAPAQPWSAPPRERAPQAFTCLIFSRLGTGRRGPRSASPSSSFPGQNQRSRRRLLPPLLQQPTSNRPLGATAQAPASGANNARLRAQTNVVTAARPGGSGAEPGCCQKDSLAPFSFRVFPTPKRLTPNPEFRHARQKGLTA